MLLQTAALLLFVLAISSPVVTAGDDNELVAFNVRPHVDNQVEVSIGKRRRKWTCRFSYSCTGGSSEEWTAELIKVDDGVSCVISRPNPPSYMLFTKWQLEIEGPGAPKIDYIRARDNDGEVSGYEQKGDTVLSADSAGAWAGAMINLEVMAKKTK